MKKFSLRDGLEWVDVREKWNFRAGSLWLYVYGLELVVKRKLCQELTFILSCPSYGC